MNRPTLLVPALALLLAACGSETAAPPEAPATAEPATSDLEGTAPPATTPDGALTAIPASFVGVWDAETGTCDPASDLRLEIAPSDVGFYESQGTVQRVDQQSDGSALVALAMEGEGESWNTRMTLRVTGQGEARRLSVQHMRDPAPETLTLKPCPA